VSGTIVALPLSVKKKAKGDESVINRLFLSAVLLIGTTLLARVLATAADDDLNAISNGRKLLAPNID
jgi:hypothetical protein